MSQSLSPREVVVRLLQAITDRRWNEIPNLYAEDTLVELPFALPTPERIGGREAIRKHFTEDAPARPVQVAARNVLVHETADPEVVVVEYDYDGQATTTGRTFTVANVLVARIRDGRIVSSRDYHNHLAFAVAMDHLPELVSALTEQRGPATEDR